MSEETILTGVTHINNSEWLHEYLNDAINLNSIGLSDEELENFEQYPDDPLIVGAIHTGFNDKGEPTFDFDPKAEFTAIVGETYVQVVKSKYYSECAMCSLCFPMQGDLDNAGSNKSYTLPSDVWGDREHLEVKEI